MYNLNYLFGICIVRKLILFSMLFVLAACDQLSGRDDSYDDVKPESWPVGSLGKINPENKTHMACVQRLYNPNLKGSYDDWWSEVSSDEFCGTLNEYDFELACIMSEEFTDTESRYPNDPNVIKYPIEYDNKDIYGLWGCYFKPSENSGRDGVPEFNVVEGSDTDKWLVENNIVHKHSLKVDGKFTIWNEVAKH